MPQKTFVLGLGAQKAGTTWVHEYLSQFPQFAPGALKEYHVWDGTDLEELRYFDARRNALRDRVAALIGQDRAASLLRARLQRGMDAYAGYFGELLAGPGIAVTADITPTYCALSEARLRQIREAMAARSIAVRAIFLMRDPVERCWSAVRMAQRKQDAAKARDRGVVISDSEEQALLDYARSAQSHLRTAYHEAVPRLRAAFAPEELFIGTYEALFTEAEIARLSDFCGVPFRPEFAGERVNVSEKGAPISAAARQAVEAEYAPVYAWCRAEFPQTAALWDGLRPAG